MHKGMNRSSCRHATQQLVSAMQKCTQEVLALGRPRRSRAVQRSVQRSAICRSVLSTRILGLTNEVCEELGHLWSIPAGALAPRAVSLQPAGKSYLGAVPQGTGSGRKIVAVSLEPAGKSYLGASIAWNRKRPENRTWDMPGPSGSM